MTNRINIKVSREDTGARLDRWFKRYYPKAQFIQIAKASRKGDIKIDGKQSDVSAQIREGQEISFPHRVVTQSPREGGAGEGRSDSRNHRGDSRFGEERRDDRGGTRGFGRNAEGRSGEVHRDGNRQGNNRPEGYSDRGSRPNRSGEDRDRTRGSEDRGREFGGHNESRGEPRVGPRGEPRREGGGFERKTGGYEGRSGGERRDNREGGYRGDGGYRGGGGERRDDRRDGGGSRYGMVREARDRDGGAHPTRFGWSENGKKDFSRKSEGRREDFGRGNDDRGKRSLSRDGSDGRRGREDRGGFARNAEGRTGDGRSGGNRPDGYSDRSPRPNRFGENRDRIRGGEDKGDRTRGFGGHNESRGEPRVGPRGEPRREGGGFERKTGGYERREGMGGGRDDRRDGGERRYGGGGKGGEKDFGRNAEGHSRDGRGGDNRSSGEGRSGGSSRFEGRSERSPRDEGGQSDGGRKGYYENKRREEGSTGRDTNKRTEGVVYEKREYRSGNSRNLDERGSGDRKSYRGRGDRGGGDSRRNDNRGTGGEGHRSPSDEHRQQLLAEKLLEAMVYKDDEVLILNKPAGIATQGGTGISISVDDLLDYMKFDYERRPRLVHRLDKETSGVLVLARRFDSAAKVSEAFREKQVHKKYIAIWCGVPTVHEGIIDAPLHKEGDAHTKGNMVEDEVNGKEAVTNYKVLAHSDFFSLVELTIPTGRMHHIRAHSAIIGCPVLGDYRYSKAPTRNESGDGIGSATDEDGAGTGETINEIAVMYSKAHREAKFMHLHAKQIEFNMDDRKIQAEAPLPEYFTQTIMKYGLRNDGPQDGHKMTGENVD